MNNYHLIHAPKYLSLQKNYIMKNKHLLFLLLISLISISSCTMEKRHYQSGYYIDWKKNVNTASNNNKEKTDFEKVSAKSIVTSDVSASTSEELILTDSKVQIINSNSEVTKRNEVKSNTSHSKVTLKEKVKVVKAIHQAKKAASKRGDADGVPTILLYVFALILPPVAVGLVTVWDLEQTLINVALTFLCWLPGIVHAIIVVNRNRGY